MEQGDLADVVVKELSLSFYAKSDETKVRFVVKEQDFGVKELFRAG